MCGRARPGIQVFLLWVHSSSYHITQCNLGAFLNRDQIKPLPCVETSDYFSLLTWDQIPLICHQNPFHCFFFLFFSYLFPTAALHLPMSLANLIYHWVLSVLPPYYGSTWNGYPLLPTLHPSHFSKHNSGPTSSQTRLGDLIQATLVPLPAPFVSCPTTHMALMCPCIFTPQLQVHELLGPHLLWYLLPTFSFHRAWLRVSGSIHVC